MIALCFLGGYIIDVIIGIQMKDELGRPGVGYQQLAKQAAVDRKAPAVPTKGTCFYSCTWRTTMIS